MAEVCTAKFRWTREEYIRAMQEHQRQKLRRPILLTIQIFSAILLLVVVAIVLASVFLPSTSRPPILGVIILVLFSLYWLTFERFNPWYWSRGFSKRPDANIEIEWHFSKTGITMQSSLGTGNVTWNSFVKIVETRDGFLFYPLKKLFHWLPFAAFESPECIAQVRLLIAANGY